MRRDIRAVAIVMAVLKAQHAITVGGPAPSMAELWGEAAAIVEYASDPPENESVPARVSELRDAFRAGVEFMDTWKKWASSGDIESKLEAELDKRFPAAALSGETTT